LRPIVEAVAVLVVRIDQEYAQVRPRLENLAQQQRDAARFADTGGAEHREMLAHHVVDIDAGRDRGVLLQRADVDGARAGHVEDQPQLVLRDQLHGIADHRIFGDAALEELPAPVVVLDLAEHVERAGRKLALARLPLRIDPGDHADHDGGAGADAEEFSDGRAHVARRDREAHLRLAAADRKHAPERLCGVLHQFHALLPVSLRE
jgi:hypothetical protein